MCRQLGLHTQLLQFISNFYVKLFITVTKQEYCLQIIYKSINIFRIKLWSERLKLTILVKFLIFCGRASETPLPARRHTT